MTYTNQAPVGITQCKGRWPENVLRSLELVVNGNTQNNQVTTVVNRDLPWEPCNDVMYGWWGWGLYEYHHQSLFLPFRSNRQESVP